MLNLFNIEYSVVLFVLVISVARSDETGCTCKNLLNSDGGGNCQSASQWCYVAQPSTCSDLIDGQKLDGEKFSYEACATKGFAEVTSFAGDCLYESGKTGLIGSSGVETATLCYKKCHVTPGCVAFSYSPEGKKECKGFRGGPYTQGNGAAGTTCYLIPPVICSTDDDCVGGQVCSSSGVCGGWYLGLEDQNCDDACNLHGGLECSEGEFHRYNSDIDSSDEVLALIRNLGGETPVTTCSGDYGTGSATPNFSPKVCGYSDPSRDVSSFDCGKAPTLRKQKQRLCRCHASVACASKANCPENFPFCENGFCSETGLNKGERGKCPKGAWTIDAGGRDLERWGCHSDCPGKEGYSDCKCKCTYANSCEEITGKVEGEAGCSSEHNCKWTTDVNEESGECVTIGQMIPGWKVIWDQEWSKGKEYCEKKVGWNNQKQTVNECFLYCKTNEATVAQYDNSNQNCACCNDPPVWIRNSQGYSITTYQFEQSSTA